MADSVRKVRYGYVMVPNRPGQAARMLQELKNEGVDLVAFSGFPGKKGAQVDLVTHDMTGLKRVARRNGWKLSAAKKGFLDAAQTIGRLAVAPDAGKLEAAWEKAKAQFAELHTGVPSGG